ncbi:MAG: hypothetical protein LLG04_18780 [Parachlamydia sp.]|nr:hypothetical protein [Parachlamydia sp.]
MDPAKSVHRATAHSSHPPDVAMSDSSNPKIEDIRQQALARRPSEGGRNSKAARHTREDAIGTSILFLEQLKRFPTENPGNKFSELAEKMAQQPIHQKDIPRLLAILHRDNLAIFKKVSPLPESTKTALLTVAAKLLQFRMRAASPQDDADTHLNNSVPYQSLFPVLGWLFEVQTPQLPKEYEEVLVGALVLFSFDSCEGVAGTATCTMFNDETLPQVSATRILLPAAWNRLAAFPLTQETIVPVIALLALHHREEVWNSIPKLPSEAAVCLQNKLKSIVDPQTCCTLLAELARIHDIWYFPPVEGSLLRDALNMLSAGSRMIPDRSFEMAIIGFTAILTHETPYRLFLRQHTQREIVANRLVQIIPNLCQMRLSVEGLASLFRLMISNWVAKKWKEPLLPLIQQYDGDKSVKPSLVLTTVIRNLLNVSKQCEYTFQDIQGLFDHIVCQFLLSSPGYEQMYQFFKLLEMLKEFKPCPTFSQAIEDSLSRWYQNMVATDISAPPSRTAHDQNPTPEYVKLYGLLVLAQFLPAARYQRLTHQFIRDHLQFDIVNPLDTSQTFSILLRELFLTMSLLPNAEELQIDPTYTLLRYLLTSSIISPVSASQIYSHHLLLSIRHVLSCGPEDEEPSCFFVHDMCQLAERELLPPLTDAARAALQTLLANLNNYEHIFENLDQLTSHPSLKPLLPNKPAVYATYISSWSPPSLILKHWNAVYLIVKAGFLKGLDIDKSLFLRDQVCEQLNQLLQDDSHWTMEVSTCISAALEALIQDGCLHRFHSDMTEEMINTRKEQIELLHQQITTKIKSVSTKIV